MLPEPRSPADEAKLRHLLEAHPDVAARRLFSVSLTLR
jgi:hypothetical protein